MGVLLYPSDSESALPAERDGRVLFLSALCAAAAASREGARHAPEEDEDLDEGHARHAEEEAPYASRSGCNLTELRPEHWLYIQIDTYKVGR